MTDEIPEKTHIGFGLWRAIRLSIILGIYAGVFLLYIIFDSGNWYLPFMFIGVLPTYILAFTSKKTYEKWVKRKLRAQESKEFERQFDKDIRTIRKKHGRYYPNVSELHEYLQSRSWNYTGHFRSSRRVPKGWSGSVEETVEIYTWDNQKFSDFQVFAVCSTDNNGTWYETEKIRELKDDHWERRKN